jgi:regulator of protease activity HflC (stomatin/prohibitin superfamily)
MKKRYDDSPVEFLTVDIGNIDYPEEIVQSVIRKFVTQQQDQKAAIQGRIAQEQIAIGEEDAKGVAEAQTIIRTTLDPMFLQYEALQAVEQLAGSPNTTFLIAPFGGEGGAPLIMNLDK